MKFFKDKRFKVLLFLSFLLVGVAAAYLLLTRGKQQEPKTPPINISPASELRLVEVWPDEGLREDVDRFSPTFFRFSSAVDVNTANVIINPPHAVKKYVYEHSPDVLVIEPLSTPWASGVNYSITILKGLKGVDGSELKSDAIYNFINRPPEYIDFE